MTVTSQIEQSVQRLPTASQAEVLHFVEYLLAKAEREAGRHEQEDWSGLSLALAMRGLEDEPSLYTHADLKVVF